MLRHSWKLFLNICLHTKMANRLKPGCVLTDEQTLTRLDWGGHKSKVNFIFQLIMRHIWIAYILSSTLSLKFFTYVAEHETGSINFNSPQRCSVFIMHDCHLEECEWNKTERGLQYVLTLWETALFSAGCKSWNHFGSEWINDGKAEEKHEQAN